MDGYLRSCRNHALAARHGALVMVDDCHATGFHVGRRDGGTPAHFGVDVDILTGTLGKALGGALGGYIAGPQAVVDLLRQRGAALSVLERLAACGGGGGACGAGYRRGGG